MSQSKLRTPPKNVQFRGMLNLERETRLELATLCLGTRLVATPTSVLDSKTSVKLR